MLQLTKPLAFIDLETTGVNLATDRIIEIAIIKVLPDGKRSIKRKLINPKMPIPKQSSDVHGITDEMVKDAPKFHEVAKEIVQFTEGKIFVAHNVRFDYSFVKKEFADLGYTYQRKTLCTVRLSRSLIPGLPSYSLGKLCKSINIPLELRHRAIGDAEATAKLFDKLIKLNEKAVTGSEDVVTAAELLADPRIGRGRRELAEVDRIELRSVNRTEARALVEKPVASPARHHLIAVRG